MVNVPGMGAKAPQRVVFTPEELAALNAMARLSESEDGKAILKYLDAMVETDGNQMETAVIASNDRLASFIAGKRQRIREFATHIRGASALLAKMEE